jgi:uncharacterized Zn-finger protein
MLRFELICPQCKHHMKYEARDAILANKVKKCVYCGKNYRVRTNIIKQLF